MLISVANHFLALFANEGVQALHNMLQRTRVVYRKTRAKNGEADHEQDEHQELHRYIVGDGCLRIRRTQMKSTQNRIRYAGEVLVKKGRYPQLMHECLTRRIGIRCCTCILSALAEVGAKTTRESKSTPQSDNQLNCDFARYGRDWKAHTPQKTVKTNA